MNLNFVAKNQMKIIFVTQIRLFSYQKINNIFSPLQSWKLWRYLSHFSSFLPEFLHINKNERTFYLTFRSWEFPYRLSTSKFKTKITPMATTAAHKNNPKICNGLSNLAMFLTSNCKWSIDLCCNRCFCWERCSRLR